MKSNKKKAFTLTELLVVVIVIGVLSAAVLPKFSKVIETRKTTEAEELMASVRTEQEKRCALDKQYLTQMSEMTDIVKNNDTKNFTITLAERGIDAESKGKYSYTLKMPSYADGRICCDGAECSKLNKNYPTCEELKGKPDYQESPADCAGVIVEPEEPSGPCDIDPYSCECNPNQAKCCAEDEVWQDGKCSPKPKECTGPKPATSQECNTCGTQTRTVTCDTTTGEWAEGEWGECSVKDENECEETTCYAKAQAGELKSYCIQSEMVPKDYFNRNTKLSPSNCCRTCESAGGVWGLNKDGEKDCIRSRWNIEEAEYFVGIRFNNSTDIGLRQDTWGYSFNDALSQFPQYGYNPDLSNPTGSCDFSSQQHISMNELLDENAMKQKCTDECGSKESCDVTMFSVKASWSQLYKESSANGQTACCIKYAYDPTNYGKEVDLFKLSTCSSSLVSTDSVVNKCKDLSGNVTFGTSFHLDEVKNACSLYEDTHGVKLAYGDGTVGWNDVECGDQAYPAGQECNQHKKCKTVTGVPSNVCESSGKTYDLTDDCYLDAATCSYTIQGAIIAKYSCVRSNNRNEGESVVSQ